MAILLTTDLDGRPTAYYNTSIHAPEQIPGEAIEISDEDYAALREVKTRRFVNGEVVDGPEPSPDLYEYAASRRWEAEMGGIVIDLGGGNSIAVPTDDRTRGVLTAAWAKATADANYEVANWKIAHGTYVTLPSATIIAIASAVEAHVQACFSINKAVDDAIAAETITTTAEIDAAAWPSDGSS